MSLAQNVLFFGRLLRAAGLPIGTGQILDAVSAVEHVGVESRDGIYWALATCFVRRREERVLFDEAFERYFKDRVVSQSYFAQIIADSKIPRRAAPGKRSRRIDEAFQPRTRSEPNQKRTEFDLTMTASDVETLRTRDFERMSAEEVRAAEAAIKRMLLAPAKRVKLRRTVPGAGRQLDLRRMLRASLQSDVIPLRFRGPKETEPPLVALCDVSGSMERYSRMVLHFLHALTRHRARVSSFVFGTRLTNITRRLRGRDVDEALAAIGTDVTDWAGGTRIGDSLRAFNKVWSRRVLGPRVTTVILITDGLERGGVDSLRTLEREIARLHRSCGRLIWLNPLLRFSGFEPLARGVRSILANVDEFRPVHHLESLEQLSEALS
jgi:uncharacterized protein with von Willebrand factor type A (vWA) domain